MEKKEKKDLSQFLILRLRMNLRICSYPKSDDAKKNDDVMERLEILRIKRSLGKK